MINISVRKDDFSSWKYLSKIQDIIRQNRLLPKVHYGALIYIYSSRFNFESQNNILCLGLRSVDLHIFYSSKFGLMGVLEKIF